ncbi:AAA family ATPase [Xanthobacter sp.]|uniref:AAA family ATPase n=1 Tax=Xanthobacter sp. TaxID=35809 RepID=UPI0035AF7022
MELMDEKFAYGKPETGINREYVAEFFQKHPERTAFFGKALPQDIDRIDVQSRDGEVRARRLAYLMHLGLEPITVFERIGRLRRRDGIQWREATLLAHGDVVRADSGMLANALAEFNSKNYILPGLFHLSAFHFWSEQIDAVAVDRGEYVPLSMEAMIARARPMKPEIKYRHETLLDALLRQRVGMKARKAGLTLTFDGDASASPPPMLVKKLVPLTGIAFLGGQSGAGKTFVAVDLAVALASGSTFFGCPVQERVGVVILAGEGGDTLASRVLAARMARGMDWRLPIAWMDVPDLNDKQSMAATVDALRGADQAFRDKHGVRLGLVVIDTMAASFSMKDENDNAEASAIIRSMKGIAKALSVAVMPVHHYGKGVETGLRGASAWQAGADAVLSVQADRDQITGHVGNRRLVVTKSRIGGGGWSSAFDLRFIPSGIDEDGSVIGSCYIDAQPPQRGDGGETEILKARPLRGDAKAYFDALMVVLTQGGQKVRPFGSEGPEVVAADREDVRREFYASRPADGDDAGKLSSARQKAFRRGEDALLAGSRIACREVHETQLVWLAAERTGRDGGVSA